MCSWLNQARHILHLEQVHHALPCPAISSASDLHFWLTYCHACHACHSCRAMPCHDLHWAQVYHVMTLRGVEPTVATFGKPQEWYSMTLTQKASGQLG